MRRLRRWWRYRSTYRALVADRERADYRVCPVHEAAFRRQALTRADLPEWDREMGRHFRLARLAGGRPGKMTP